MSRLAQGVIALGLLLVTGLVHGKWTGRWSIAHELEEAAVRLGQAPEDLGDWKASPASLDADSLARAGAVGSWIRTYRHTSTGEVLNVILICGRAGPMSVHRPEDCYSSAGYDLVTPVTQTTCLQHDGTAAEFRTAVFSKPGPEGPSSLRILWTWYTGQAWQAPDSPRLKFAHLPVLYKLYVIRALSRPPGVPSLPVIAADRLEGEPAVVFIQQLLPELDKLLAKPGGS